MKWTNKEINCLKQAVLDNPTNLNQAFLLVGDNIGKSKDSVSKYYYNNRSKFHLFTLNTKTKKYNNIKVVPSKPLINFEKIKKESVKLSVFQKIELINLLLEL